MPSTVMLKTENVVSLNFMCYIIVYGTDSRLLNKSAKGKVERKGCLLYSRKMLLPKKLIFKKKLIFFIQFFIQSFSFSHLKRIFFKTPSKVEIFQKTKGN